MILMNDRNYVNELITSGEFSIKVKRDIDLLSKYMLESYDKKEVVLKILKFMEENLDGFIEAKWVDDVEKIVFKNDKECARLNEIEYVNISQKEIDIIRGLETKEERYLLFTLITLAKFRNMINEKNNNWVNYSLSEVFKMANLSYANKAKQNEAIRGLKEKGLISTALSNSNLSIKVECIYDCGIVMKIYMLEKLGKQYDDYIKIRYMGYKSCEVCGNPFKRKKKDYSGLYCDVCKRTKELEKKNKWWQENKKLDRA